MDVCVCVCTRGTCDWVGGVSVCARGRAVFCVCMCAHTHRAVNAHSSSNSHPELGEGKIGSHQREKVKGWAGVVALTLAAPGRAGVAGECPAPCPHGSSVRTAPQRLGLCMTTARKRGDKMQKGGGWGATKRKKKERELNH